MPYISYLDAPNFELHGASFTGLASPSRGSIENAVWIVTLHPGTTGMPHKLNREEIFVGLEGCASARINEQTYEITVGDALVVPANAEFQISNLASTQFRAVAVLPVGGQAALENNILFTPPWTA